MTEDLKDFNDIATLQAEQKEELAKKYNQAVEKAKIVVNGSDYSEYKTIFKDYEKATIQSMISHKNKTKDEAYNHFIFCLSKLEAFYDIFEPVEAMASV